MKAVYAQAILEGLSQVVRDGGTLPWASALTLARWTVAHPDEEGDWRWAKTEAVRLVREAVEKDRIPAEMAETTWAIVEDLHAAKDTWRIEAGQRAGDSLPGFYGIVSHAMGSPAGDAIDLAMGVALWNVRRARNGAEVTTGAQRVLPLLEHALDREGTPGRAARVVIGRYLPWIMLIDEEWPLRHSGRLFVGDMGGPDWDPVWGGYLTRARYFDNVFDRLRPWYVRSANALAPPGGDGDDAHDRDYAPDRHLALHLVLAIVRGRAAPGDPDRLVELFFNRVAADDLSHAYWELYRDFTEADEPPSSVALDRLVRLWEWRLAELEGQGARAGAEAGGLGWLFMVEAVPDGAALDLLMRTAWLSEGVFPMRHSLWQRLSMIAALDPSHAVNVASCLIEAELQSEYPYFNYDEVAPVLAVGLADRATRKTAERLLNMLGERGFVEYGGLRS